MNKRGSVALVVALIIVIVLVAVGGVWYWETHKSGVNNSQPQGVSIAQTTSTYQDTDYGIAFDYPNTWIVKSGDTAEGDYGLYTQYDSSTVSLITVEIPPSLYPGTNLEGAYFNLSVNKQLSQSQCLALIPPIGPNNSPDKVIAIDGVTFTRYAAGGVAAGTYEFTENYSGYTNGTCYEFNLGDTTGNDVSPTGTRMSGDANDISVLEGVLSSVKFASSVSAVSGITIPATSTSLVAISQDPYELFMTTPANSAGLDSFFGGNYLKDGTIESGPYAGYDRLLFSDVLDCDLDVCVTVSLSFATKDYQSFILDNDTTTGDALHTLANYAIYLNTTKIVGQGTIPFAFPQTVAAGGVAFDRSYNYSTSSSPQYAVSLPSPVQGLSFSYDYNSLPANATSSDNSDAQNGYIETVNQYVADLSSWVRARDGAGVMTTYSLSMPPYAPNDIFKGIASDTIFTSYGSEGCFVNRDPWYVLKNISNSDLALVGTNQSGTAIYALKDPNHPLNQAAYYSEVSSVQNFRPQNNNVSVPSFGDFIAKHPILIIKDPFGRFLAIDEIQYSYANEDGCGGKKPVIYLYPPKPTPVTVRFAAPIDLSLSIPAYEKGWSVLAHPDGALQDLQPQFTDCGSIDATALGSEYATTACEENDYPYLYWAGYIGQQFPNLSGGWVVARSDIKPFLEEKLTEVGLNQKEKDDMMDYWVSELSAFGAPYYHISFLQTAQMDALVPLAISPKPDTEFRLFLLWSPLSGMPTTQPQPQMLQPLVRKGFTVVEWGGGEQ